MDYGEEQRNEIEALEAIYPSEYTLLSEDPITFTIVAKTAEYEDTGEGYTSLIKFILTPKYPEEVPEIDIVSAEEDEQTNLEADVIEGLLSELSDQAAENTGMAMIFTLVSASIEYLNSRWDGLIKEKEDNEEKKRLREEEEEQKRFDGTRVTIQTFIEWKSKFEAEMAAKKKVLEAKEKDNSNNKKLTGKELFLMDKTLNDSDLTFDEGDDSVPIDESLFEDIEDLEIDEEDEEEGDDE